MDLESVITTDEQLRTLYRAPSSTAASKNRDRIDPESARFIARSPLVLFATSGADGRCDVSPRGGPPGFVAMLDDRHVALPDLNGNNRLDSLGNLIANPQCGLLFVVPGSDDTVRINGRAVITTDARVLDACAGDIRTPKLAVVVTTDELYVHCAKSFRRARAWEPESWPEPGEVPDLAAIYACQLGIDAAEKRTELEKVYAESLALD